MKVASLKDILEMKKDAYSERREAKDLFDVFCILKEKGGSAMMKKLIAKNGLPKNMEDINAIALNHEDVEAFQKVFTDAP